MSNKILQFLVSVYYLGIPVCWAYLIAHAVNGGTSGDIGAFVLFGWVAGIAWPMVALVQVFLWTFF